MDRILLQDLAVWYRVGVADEERARSQKLLITIAMSHDLSRAGQFDDLRDTIDYDAVSKRVAALGETQQWRLIEKVAADIAEIILSEFGAEAVTVEVKKFILPETRYVSVMVERRRSR
ncbi:MAG TPA: dihydroneopterin aldolase [Candidatus Paceibacterota bacterium]|nr:dihydroneopterin aldolase [Verrucomicrobiota bacterium]HOX03948.1 dihydroneopterin aldolase [Verrucomicrobiota bacterium]HRZ46751.1 dihydroneopterin aldolase [Candidatus Paceibacterota bacterium]HRZ92369.1 dihydroneopterin aldolase [Candidatus Paceibacterota bacterium]